MQQRSGKIAAIALIVGVVVGLGSLEPVEGVARVYIDPGSVIFGDTVVDTSSVSSAVALRFAHVRGSTLVAALTGADAGSFVQTSTCDSTPPDGSCSIGISFRPAREGSHSATLEISDDSNRVLATAKIAGAGLKTDGSTHLPVARVRVSSDAIRFGEVLLNTSSGPRKVTLELENVQGSTLVVSLKGADAGSFERSNDCGSAPSGSSCSIAITFRPERLGSHKAALEIRDDGKELARVALTGTGTQAPPPPIPVITMLPNPVTLSPQEVGTGNGGYPVAITNSGKVPVVVAYQPGAGSSEIQLRNICAGTTLQPNQTCSETIDFTPLSRGSFARQFDVVAGGTVLRTLHVTGSGAQAVVELDPAVLGFDAQQETKPIIVRNNGDAPLRIISWTPPARPKEFKADAMSCVQSHVPPGGSCQILVSVLQFPREQAQQGVIQVTDNAPGSPRSIQFRAEPYFAKLVAAPPGLEFGRVVVGHSQNLRVSIRNVGNAPTGPMRLSAGGGFQIVDSQCQQLDPDGAASCEVTVQFTPASAQEYTSRSLDFRFPNGRPFGVSLTGTGYQEQPAGTPVVQ